MKKWLQDDLFKAVLKNTGKLASGKLAGAIFGLVALLCTSRGMNAHDFGALTMIMAYAESVTSIVQFQAWQVVLHYAAIPLQDRQIDRVKTAIRFSVGLDIVTGLTGMIGGMLAILLFSNYLEIHGHYKNMALFYCTLIPFMCASSVYGILRLFDKINIVAHQQAAVPFVRAIFSVIVWIMHGDLIGFVWAWYAGKLAGHLYMWVGAFLELRHRQMLDSLRPALLKAAREMPKGLWGFVWTASLTVILEATWKPVTNLVIGKCLGTSASGLYTLASTFLNVVQRPARLLEKSYYPEVVKLDPRTLQPWKLALRTSVLSACVGVLATLLIYVGGKPIISIFGQRYADAAPLMVWMSPALIFFMAGLPMEGVLYTAGRAKYIMFAHFIGVICYIPLLTSLSYYYGLNGAGLSYAVGMLLLTVMTFILTITTFFKRHRIIPPHEREVK